MRQNSGQHALADATNRVSRSAELALLHLVRFVVGRIVQSGNDPVREGVRRRPGTDDSACVAGGRTDRDHSRASARHVHLRHKWWLVELQSPESLLNLITA